MSEQAFPVPAELDMVNPQPGMALRDYFAAAALSALINKISLGDFNVYGTVAERAYRMADAMMKQRKENDQTP